MAPHPRKTLNPKSSDFGVRFAIHLRAMLDDRKLGPSAFLDLASRIALPVATDTIGLEPGGKFDPLFLAQTVGVSIKCPSFIGPSSNVRDATPSAKHAVKADGVSRH